MPKGVDKKLSKVLYSGFIGQGKQVEVFESLLSRFFNNRNILSLNSATSALFLALRLINLKPGDEIISTPMTCTATNMPIFSFGVKIIWADVNPITGLIDINDIEKKITKKTKAIMLVHFGGIPCDVIKINKLARKFNIKVIEDAAHALGSEFKNRKIGNYSDFVVFSLQAIKHITTGDGGILVCKKREDYKRGKLLRWFGINRDEKRNDFRCENDIKEYGYKFHMNDLAATIGIEQMKYLKNIIIKNNSNAKFFTQKLKSIKGIGLINIPPGARPSYWIFTIHIYKEGNRDHFIKWMAKNKIMTSRVHERNDIHTAFSEFQTKLPNLDKFNSTQVSIPVGWWLKKTDLNYIAKKIIKYSTLFLN